MQTTMKSTAVKSMARDAVHALEHYQLNHPGSRTAQLVKVRGMLSFMDALQNSATVTISQDDYVALTQLP